MDGSTHYFLFKALFVLLVKNNLRFSTKILNRLPSVYELILKVSNWIEFVLSAYVKEYIIGFYSFSVCTLIKHSITHFELLIFLLASQYL